MDGIQEREEEEQRDDIALLENVEDEVRRQGDDKGVAMRGGGGAV